MVKTENPKVLNVFQPYIQHYDLKAKKGLEHLTKIFDPDNFLEDYDIPGDYRDLSILKVIIDMTTKTQGIYSAYNDKNNTLTIYLKNSLNLFQQPLSSNVFKEILDNVLDQIKIDSHHELMHWVQYKVMQPEGYDVDKNVSPSFNQSMEEAYKEDYFKAERELYPLLNNAIYELEDIAERKQEPINNHDLKVFTGQIESEEGIVPVSKIFLRIKEEDYKHWERAVTEFYKMVENKGLLSTNRN